MHRLVLLIALLTSLPAGADETLLAQTGPEVAVGQIQFGSLETGDQTLTSGSDTMTLSAFTSDVASALSGGAETFNVGATLAVGINQSTGAYTGTYLVTVNYN